MPQRLHMWQRYHSALCLGLVKNESRFGHTFVLVEDVFTRASLAAPGLRYQACYEQRRGNWPELVIEQLEQVLLVENPLHARQDLHAARGMGTQSTGVSTGVSTQSTGVSTQSTGVSTQSTGVSTQSTGVSTCSFRVQMRFHMGIAARGRLQQLTPTANAEVRN
jgi:hypothetical protein